MADPARSILVVDDEAEIRNLLTDLLKDAGYKSRHATTGAEAIEEVGKSMPDLVMMDVKLPDQDGIDVLRQLKREHPDLEVIVMTAYGGARPSPSRRCSSAPTTTSPSRSTSTTLLATVQALLRDARH